MTKSTRLRWHFAAIGALVINAACSLGDGVTTDCLTDGTCNELGACDDGNGGVDPNQPGCCELAAERQYGLCAQTTVTSDAYETCTATMDQACCNVLLNEFNTCMSNPTGGGGQGGDGGQAAGSGGQANQGGQTSQGGQTNQGGQGGA